MADIYWPGTEVPIGQIKPYLHRFLDEYSGGRIHCAYAQPFCPEYTQVDYLFRLIYVFEGRFITSARSTAESRIGKLSEASVSSEEEHIGIMSTWRIAAAKPFRSSSPATISGCSIRNSETEKFCSSPTASAV